MTIERLFNRKALLTGKFVDDLALGKA